MIHNCIRTIMQNNLQNHLFGFTCKILNFTICNKNSQIFCFYACLLFRCSFFRFCLVKRCIVIVFFQIVCAAVMPTSDMDLVCTGDKYGSMGIWLIEVILFLIFFGPFVHDIFLAASTKPICSLFRHAVGSCNQQMFIIKYNGDLNTNPVWYSNGKKRLEAKWSCI